MADEGSATTASILDWIQDPQKAEGWETFAVRYRKRIKGWCQRNGLNDADADDVTQQLLLAIRDKVRTYVREEGRFLNWLERVTKNACNNWFRETKRSRAFQPLMDNIPAQQDLLRALNDEHYTYLLQVVMAEVQRGVTNRDWKIWIEMTFKKRNAEDLATEFGVTKAAVFKAKSRIAGKITERLRELDEGSDPGNLIHA
jgi:RNA polymerase sigma-70 factor (ECF subfamily)